MSTLQGLYGDPVGMRLENSPTEGKPWSSLRGKSINCGLWSKEDASWTAEMRCLQMVWLLSHTHKEGKLRPHHQPSAGIFCQKVGRSWA